MINFQYESYHGGRRNKKWNHLIYLSIKMIMSANQLVVIKWEYGRQKYETNTIKLYLKMDTLCIWAIRSKINSEMWGNELSDLFFASTNWYWKHFGISLAFQESFSRKWRQIMWICVFFFFGRQFIQGDIGLELYFFEFLMEFL